MDKNKLIDEKKLLRFEAIVDKICIFISFAVLLYAFIDSVGADLTVSALILFLILASGLGCLIGVVLSSILCYTIFSPDKISSIYNKIRGR